MENKVKAAPIKNWKELQWCLESVATKYNTKPRLEYLQSITANVNISYNFPSEKFVLERIRENDKIIMFKKFVLGKLILEELSLEKFVIRENGLEKVMWNLSKVT